MTKFKVTSYIRHHPSDIIHLFRTSPVPFNLEGAPPLSCILPPQEEENRSACRSYIKVSADHQRSKGLSPVQSSKFNGLRPVQRGFAAVQSSTAFGQFNAASPQFKVQRPSASSTRLRRSSKFKVGAALPRFKVQRAVGPVQG